MKSYLSTNLKIIKIYDGEEYFIAAKSKEEALRLFMRELNVSGLRESDLKIREIKENEDVQIKLNGDEGVIIQVINKTRRGKDMRDTISMWKLLKYTLIENEMRDREIVIPYIIASSSSS